MRIFPKLGKGYIQTSSLLKQIVHQRVSSLLASFGSMTECEYKKKHKQFFPPPFEIESLRKAQFLMTFGEQSVMTAHIDQYLSNEYPVFP